VSTYQPLRVRADLAAGVAHAAPWGIALDGLLAAQVWVEHKATTHPTYRALEQAEPPDLDLPLARCTPPAGPWHWAATCAHPAGPTAQDVHTWTGRVDHADLELVATALPKTISARQGRYRARRMPLLVTVCTSLTWHAIGDIEKIRALLEQVGSIGKKRSSGEGLVLAWHVDPAPELDAFTAAHLHPDGTLGRPTPDQCLAAAAAGRIIDGGYATAGIRPPYMHPSRQHELHLPAPVVP